VVLRIAIRTLTEQEAQKIIPEVAPLQLNGRRAPASSAAGPVQESSAFGRP
jgi:hypothetical protein